MSARCRQSLLLVATIIAAGCTFDGSAPGGAGREDAGPPFLVDGADPPTDGPASEGPLGDGPLGDGPLGDGPVGDGPQLVDTRVDGFSPDQLASDTRVDTVPTGCLDCGPLGCNVALGRCNRLAPSNIPSALVAALHDDSALGDCSMTSSGIVVADGIAGVFGSCRAKGKEGATQDGVYWQTILMPGNKPASLFAMNSLVIGGDLTLRASGDHPIIIYAREGIRIEGLLEAGARSEVPGPGGKTGGSFDGADGAACENGEGKGGDLRDYNSDKSGGGGGAWGQKGADGGDASTIPGGLGGALPVSSTILPLVPLRAGCGGGAGGGSEEDGGAGGAGGGAIQLSAGKLLIVDGLGVWAGGGGGTGGHQSDAGGGGGSGGSILLEGLEVRVTTGTPLSANGGGGGAGDPDYLLGEYGQDGPHDVSQALGGDGDLPAGDGGKGGARGLSPGVGQNSPHAGGGGGGVGRIHLRAQLGLMQSSKISPSATSDDRLSVW